MFVRVAPLANGGTAAGSKCRPSGISTQTASAIRRSASSRKASWTESPKPVRLPPGQGRQERTARYHPTPSKPPRRKYSAVTVAGVNDLARACLHSPLKTVWSWLHGRSLNLGRGHLHASAAVVAHERYHLIEDRRCCIRRPAKRAMHLEAGRRRLKDTVLRLFPDLGRKLLRVRSAA